MPAINDFTRLNKAVLREGATNATANRAMRANFEMKIETKPSSRNTTSYRTVAIASRSSYSSAYGKPNRPQTPVNGIITNNYGMRSEQVMKERYDNWKSSVSRLDLKSKVLF